MLVAKECTKLCLNEQIKLMQRLKKRNNDNTSLFYLVDDNFILKELEQQLKELD